MEDQDWSNEFSKAYLRSMRSRMADFLGDAPHKLSPEIWESLSLFAQFLCAATDDNAREISGVRILVTKSLQSLEGKFSSILITNQSLIKEVKQIEETQKLIASRYKHSQRLTSTLVFFVILQITVITYLVEYITK